MIVDRDAIRRGDNRALRELQAIVHRVAIGVARKFGLYDVEDDIAQESMIATIRATSVPRDDEGLIHIEGFIKESARRLALSHLRAKSRTLSVETDDEFDALAEIHGDATLEAVQEAQEAAAVERAFAMAPRKNMPTEPVNRLSTNKPRARPNSKRTRPDSMKRKATKPATGDKGREQTPKVLCDGGWVKSVREMLGLTQTQFANHLKISIHTLRNYEYGVVKNVPPATMKKVKNAQALGAATGYTSKRKPFLAMVRGWMKKLGLEQDDYSGLAAALGFNRSTVWRWFKNNVVPTRRIIDTIDTYISELADRREAHDEASRKQRAAA